MAGLTWSEHTAPNGDCPYDHIEAETPLGALRIEWKGWKKYAPASCEMPWGEMVCENDLDEVKAQVQECWNRLAVRVNEYTLKEG